MKLRRLPLFIMFELLLGLTFGHNTTEIRIDGPRIVSLNSKAILKCVDERITPDSMVYWSFKSEELSKVIEIDQHRSVWNLSEHNTVLVIPKIDISQAGLYTCCMKPKRQQIWYCVKTHLSVVKFYEHTTLLQSHVRVGHDQIIVQKNKPLQIRVHRGKFDVAVRIIKEQNVSICDKVHKQIKLPVSQRSCMRKDPSYKHSTDFYIDNTAMEESGWFQIAVSYNGTVNNYSLQILMHGPPKIEMRNETALGTDEAIVFICRGQAYPPPKIEMIFTPCHKNEICNQMKSSRLMHINITKSNDSIEFTAIGSVSTPTNGTVTCNVSNSEGNDSATAFLLLNNSNNEMTLKIVMYIIIFIVSGGIASLPYVLWYRWWRKRTQKTVMPKELEMESLAANAITLPPEYSFPKQKLLLGHRIGDGEYGVVRMAQAKDIMVHEPFTTVAVKHSKRTSDTTLVEGMLSEVKMLILIGQHVNIVNFLGVVTENIKNNELMIIFEYCRYGSVLNYMTSNRKKFVGCVDELPIDWSTMELELTKGESEDGSRTSFRTTDLICWATQIAFGMEYLSSKNVFHGDLAARNVLLCDNNVVKIADFGLTREFNHVTYYKKTRNDRVPFKWMALESIFEHKFSVKTDVWSYGVVLWELFTLGLPPYPTFAVNEEFFKKLRDGYRLEKPKYANEDIYYTMLSCWCVNPDRRPTFNYLGQFFNLMLPPELQNHYFSLNDEYLQWNTRTVNTDRLKQELEIIKQRYKFRTQHEPDRRMSI